MCALPVPDASFDIVTTGYGLRNVPDLPLAIREVARVLKPGGLFLSLDFNRPSNRIVRMAYHAYLSVVGSALGWALHRDPDTYRYIPESIRAYPGAPAVVDLLHASGFSAARWHRVLGGLMAIHEARQGLRAVLVPVGAMWARGLQCPAGPGTYRSRNGPSMPVRRSSSLSSLSPGMASPDATMCSSLNCSRPRVRFTRATTTGTGPEVSKPASM